MTKAIQNYELVYISPDDIDSVWAITEGWLLKAIERNDGEYELEDIYNGICRGIYQYWAMYNGEIKAGIVTEIADFPRKKIWIVLLLGGEDMNEWLEELNKQMTIEAKAVGCDSMHIIGRKGWVKVLPDFESKHILMSKQL